MSKFIISVSLEKLKEKFYRKGLISRASLGSGKSIAVVASLVIVVILVYLWQVNGLATKSYQINDLEEKVGELQDKNKKLELDITQLRSTERINLALQDLNMVAVAKVEYLSANGSTVAVNR